MENNLKIGKYTDLPTAGGRIIYRLLEMLPGMLSWITLAAIVLASFYYPLIAAIFIILFDIYWLIKTFYLTLHLRVGFTQMRKNMQINWLEKIEDIKNAEYTVKGVVNWRDIYHLIILPTYKEGPEIISESLEGLIKANYPKEKMIVVIAQEERAGEEHNQEITRRIESKYKDVFYRFLITKHPSGIEGEQAGKGSNIAWAARQAVRDIINKYAISHNKVVVSAFDMDTVVHPEYFGVLTYNYLTSVDPLHASYQPIPLFTNNIWEAPSFARVVSFSSTFWQMIQQERPENLITFSSHSMPLTALIDIDYWQVNMVNEDSRVFWQCLLRYDGNYRVVPIYYPVSMDANSAPSFWKTMINVYKQHRRWGYGSENVPYFLFGFIKNRRIPFAKKFFYTLVVIEGYWSWATNALILFLLGWLPLLVGGSDFNQTVLSFNLPYFTRIIMLLSMFGLITTSILSIILLPPRPIKYGRHKYIWMVVQWLLFPLTTIFLGCVPALDAQTRLMLGRYMGFWVTPKHRK
ncbi:MAG: hypothetical protein CEN90_621 [Parcubacteria group bacterium Licking1014_17]|nr:MAG: hypothetical protein CEN90_621 [Parcubacteria group bacterium Licking1014_17]